MDNQLLTIIKKAIVFKIKEKEINRMLTYFLGFITIYASFISIFDRNLIHPFSFDTNPNPILNTSQVFSTNNNDNNSTSNTNVHKLYEFPVNGKGVTWLVGAKTESFAYLQKTILSLFFLWAFSLISGRIAKYFRLPALLGMLVAGVIFANATFLSGILQIHRSWGDVIRQLSFVFCLIRCGMGINSKAFKQSWFICANLGIVSASFEVVTVVLFINFFFSIPLDVSFIFAFVLAPNSPVVTVPAMLKLEKQGRGTDKGIPTAMLTSVGIDNIFCVTAYTILNSTIFKRSYSDIMYAFTRVPVELFLGTFIGYNFGLLLGLVPGVNTKRLHLMRTILLFTTSCAFIFGSLAVKCEIVGPVLVLVMCFVASSKWKVDNEDMNRREERAFKIVWNMVLLPLLFALIGILVDFSVFSWDLFWKALLTLFIGMTARILSSFVISLSTNLNMKEKWFLAFCFVPKATVQAILVPFIIRYQTVDRDARFIALTCILGIVITAPLGELLIQIFGSICLKKDSFADDDADNLSLTLTSNLTSQFQTQTYLTGTNCKSLVDNPTIPQRIKATLSIESIECQSTNKNKICASR